MTWDNEFALSILPDLLGGLWVTIQATMSGILIALALGLIVAVIRYLRIPVLSPVFGFYVQFVRGTPLLVQAFAAFYILPDYGIVLSPLITGIIVLGVNYSSYTAEVYRSGIEDVGTGQWEAATALSLPVRPTWTRIVLPQAVRSIVPMLGNYWIQMFKDSAILSLITMNELLNVGQTIGSSEFRYLEPLTIVGILFLAVSYPAAVLIRRLERRLALTS
ncbi:ectoine/hydroxyectoine ABC transporter permease subunit EhuD [Haloechinothrix sp. YIM 98757]|uniref:Ectoine/hydroxyectoine ABC transporter permease subunit EhuD n=1 Tax=Haloechinothrix aidingensis TaxID=2752311 RepID=A0A838AEB5_9PSEU|nr:ectoine/hydroxyectoine ABC transporter permease subunit EhuD [Haloechinothrix aidingensis]MBA0127664.1 ectoine/hydroxyectoine ABC transporter permease subunit EhuD [Haloechinothrix aidingensis]